MRPVKLEVFIIKIIISLYHLSLGQTEFDQTVKAASIFSLVVRGGRWATDWTFLGLIEVEVVWPGSVEALGDVLPSFYSKWSSKSLDGSIYNPKLQILRLYFLHLFVGIKWHQRSLFKPNGTQDSLR